MSDDNEAQEQMFYTAITTMQCRNVNCIAISSVSSYFRGVESTRRRVPATPVGRRYTTTITGHFHAHRIRPERLRTRKSRKKKES